MDSDDTSSEIFDDSSDLEILEDHKDLLPPKTKRKSTLPPKLKEYDMELFGDKASGDSCQGQGQDQKGKCLRWTNTQIPKRKTLKF